ncbi:MAG: acyltransferase, partial [Bacteroidales bacterium]|nr:acyltransferase [Bacteroidales bacterium]
MEVIPADRIFTIDKFSEFERLAFDVFRYQSTYNPIYKKYLELLGIKPQDITSLEMIPFLPVEFFKHHRLITGVLVEELVFESSGTIEDRASRHYVADASLYRQS